MNDTLARTIKELARESGYIDCGIMPARPFREYLREIEKRRERFPGAAHLYESMRGRVDPCRTAPWARSILVCVHWYGKYRIPRPLDDHIGRHYLFDRRLRECPDYDIPKRMKHGLGKLGIRVKRGGIPERWAAALSGVARIGRNNFAFHDEKGSWITVESYRVDAELPPDKPRLDSPCPDTCRQCIDACPTDALVEPLIMRMDRCIAWLTYSAPRPIDPNLREKMGPWIYGCDICQRVCPLNRGRWSPAVPASWLEPLVFFLTPRALAAMDETTYQEKIHPAFWYIPRTDLERWHENAQRALCYEAGGCRSANGGTRLNGG